MKKPLLFILVSYFVTFSSCKKDNEVIVPVVDFKALKNDAAWTATNFWATYSVKSKTFQITGLLRDPQYYQEEWLGLSFVMPKFETPAATSQFSANWSFVIGGDAISDSYNIDSTAANEIHITALDTIKKQITGIFKVKLVRDSRYSDKGEAFQFKDGEFTVNYSEVE